MRKVLLVGWDAADWKVIHPLLDRGEMPNLRLLIEHGVMGDITTLEPVLSPMLWNSIGTGKLADAHGILGFTEVDPDTRRVRPVTSTSRRSKALWNILMQNGAGTHVIHWFGGHPAEPIRGVCVSDAFSRGWIDPSADWPMMPGAVHPPEAAEALADLRMAPDDIDEQMIRLFVPRAHEVDQERDPRLANLAKIIAEASSIHNAATWAMENHPWDFMGIYYPSIDHFSHGFMNFHPPRAEWVRESDFEIYQDVVASGYRLHDLFLGRLLQLAPQGATVILCSDHGFHSDHLRPREIPFIPAGPAEQHRPLGIFAMAGPGIKKDEIIYGATLLDIAPTVLYLCGLPAGRDMPGRVLLEAMEDPKPIPRIDSWETVEGEAGMHTGHVPMNAEDADALIEQFVALGYIDKPGEDASKEVIKCERERMWNLARVYLSSHRPHLALPLLEQIWDEAPDRTDYALSLAGCQARLGMAAEARATAQEAIDQLPASANLSSVLATIAALSGQPADALTHIAKAVELNPRSEDLALRHGAILMSLRRWEPAAAEFRRAAGIDPHNPQAWESLASASLRLKDWAAAAESALEAVGFDFHRPRAHMFLGIALFKLDRLPDAIRALETALGFRPPLRQAHFWMSRVLMRIPGRQEEALGHRASARVARERRLDYRDQMRRLHDEAASRASARAGHRAERRTAVEAERKAEIEKRKQAAERRKAAWEAAQDHPTHPLDLIVVSGLPRSGTSVMMQMLAAGGVPVMTDNERKADSDNPRGYLEWEALKKLETEPHVLYEAEGKAIKVISALLPHLPVIHRYKVIFMDRPIDEVAASHDKMIHNRGEKKPSLDPERMKRNLERHRRQMLRGMSKSPAFEVLIVDYPDLIRDPREAAVRVAEFLGPERVPEPGRMAEAVDASLYRNRAATLQV